MAAHLEPAYAGTVHVPLPVTELLTRDSLILPLFHELTDADQERVCAVIEREVATAARPLAAVGGADA